MSTQSVFQRIHSLSCLKWWQIKKRRALKASITIELIGLLQAIELNTRQNFKCNRDKNGIEDLKKARHYIDFLIEHIEKKDYDHNL